jgi:hypothetical protein
VAHLIPQAADTGPSQRGDRREGKAPHNLSLIVPEEESEKPSGQYLGFICDELLTH